MNFPQSTAETKKKPLVTSVPGGLEPAAEPTGYLAAAMRRGYPTSLDYPGANGSLFASRP